MPLNPPAHSGRSYRSEVSFGNDRKKRSLKKSWIREDTNRSIEEGSRNGEEDESQGLKLDHLDISEEISPNRSPSKAQFTDYSARSKNQQLERDLKNYQGKYEQANL